MGDGRSRWSGFHKTVLEPRPAGAVRFHGVRPLASLSMQVEILFDCDGNRDRLAVLHSWFEAPLRYGSNRVRIQARIKRLHHADILRDAVLRYFRLNHHRAFEPRVLGFRRILGLYFMKD